MRTHLRFAIALSVLATVAIAGPSCRSSNGHAERPATQPAGVGVGIPGTVEPEPGEKRAIVYAESRAQQRDARIRELNRDIPMLGGPGEFERLSRLIHNAFPDAAAATQRSATRPADPDFPPAVNGLTATIDDSNCSRTGIHVLLRVKNVSSKPIVIPGGNSYKGTHVPYRLICKVGRAEWKRTPWSRAEVIDDVATNSGVGGRGDDDQLPPPVTVRPMESVVILLHGWGTDALAEASNIRVTLKVGKSDVDANSWEGELSTTPRNMITLDSTFAKLRGSLPFPDQFPEFVGHSPERGLAISMMGSPNESQVDELSSANWRRYSGLELYEPNSVRSEIERRMRVEQEPVTRLYLAAVAARFGSRAGALELLEAMKSTNYEQVRNAHSALRVVASGDADHLPHWLAQLMIATLRDRRHVTDPPYESAEPLTISYHADEDAVFPYLLAEFKCRDAVPALIGMLDREHPSRGAIVALGAIGDERAVGPLLAVLKRSTGKREIFERTASALAQLKAREALPVLLAHLSHRGIIEAVEKLGDVAAVPALEDLVNPQRTLQVGGFYTGPDDATIRAAKVAIVTLKDKDPTPRYCEFLADRSLGEFERRGMVWRLGDRPDPAAIPHLITAIKTDPSGAVVNQAITVLSVYKYQAAVEGLIDCFDADFKGKSDWKRAYSPAMFRQTIAESLRAITGQPFGADKATWQEWWDREGRDTWKQRQ